MRGFLLTLAVLVLATSAAAAPPIAAYGKLPALDFVRLSPSGDKIAFVAVDGEKRRLFIRKVGGEALVVNQVGQAKVRDLRWVGDDYVLVTVSTTGKFGDKRLDRWTYTTRAELSLVLIVNLRTGVTRQMFQGKEEVVWFGAIDADYGAWKVDGRWCAFVHGYAANAGGRVFKVDLETGDFKALTALAGDDYDYVVGEGGVIVGRTRYDSYKNSWVLYEGDQGLRVVTQRPSAMGLASVEGAGRSPRTVVVSDDTGSQDTWEEFALTPGAAGVPLFAGERVQQTLHDPVSGLLIGALTYGERKAVLFDPKRQARFDAMRRAFPGLETTLMSYSSDFGRMVVETDGGDDAGTYWLVDMTTGKADELTVAYPGIGQKDVGPTRLFAYAASDGLALDGVLTLPPGSSGKDLPLVLMPHGGPIGVSDRVGFDYWAQAFASRGYAVFQPNFRGSGGRGSAFRHQGMGQWGHGMLTDMSDGVAALAKAGIVDPARVCIVGASYGGYAALAAVTVRREPYRCAVSLSGPSDMRALMMGMGDDPATPNGRYAQALLGVKTSQAKDLEAISPLRHADEATAPILLIHGKDDTVVPFVNSLSMHDLLKKAGKPVELLALDGEDHWLSREVTRTQTIEASVGFVEAHNPVGGHAP